jgi:alpha-galactosidase/6-phospho-beta-glucosidase family protein
MINFTNPVSIITQAVHQQPTRADRHLRHPARDVRRRRSRVSPASVCGYDYFGLNHLGWLRDVLFEVKDNSSAFGRTMRS